MLNSKSPHRSYKKAERHERKLQSQIARAHAAGKQKKASYLTQRYLRSYDAALIATRRAYRKLKSHRRPAKAALPEIAAGLDAWAGTNERVILYQKPKENDPHNFRLVMDFGIRNRSLQYLVRGALSAQSTLYKHQYSTHGGTYRAISEVKRALENGCTHVVEYDIRNCYPSFVGEEVEGILPLPKKVTRSIIRSTNFSIKLGGFLSSISPESKSLSAECANGFDTNLLSDARQGIPQGSAVSPLVADILLARVFAKPRKRGLVIAYADNMLVMARSDKKAASMSLALWRALKAHPAGPFWLKTPKHYPPGRLIEFLGYRIRLKKGKAIAKPSRKNRKIFEHKFSRKLAKIGVMPSIAHGRIKRKRYLKNYVKSWAGAFSHWEKAKAFKQKKLKDIQSNLSKRKKKKGYKIADGN